MSLPISVSAVVPAYQSAWSIGDTIRSVLRQSCPVRELIVVNDGSTDGLPAAVDEACDGDPRVWILDQENRGLAAARNRGLAAATSDLIAFIDADDIWHPQFVGRVGEALLADPPAPFAYAYSFRFDGRNRCFPPAPPRRVPRHDLIGLLTLNSVGNGSAAIFRRERILAVGGFDETHRQLGEHGAEDWKLILQLAATGRPALVPLPLVGYRYTAGGMSQSSPLRQFRAIQRVLAEIRTACPEVGERHFADANTMMTGWLLPAMIRHESPWIVARLVFLAYALNPGWIRSADLRALHARKIGELARGALSQWLPALRARPLSELEMDGTRPFAYLGESRLSGRGSATCR